MTEEEEIRKIVYEALDEVVSARVAKSLRNHSKQIQDMGNRLTAQVLRWSLFSTFTTEMADPVFASRFASILSNHDDWWNHPEQRMRSLKEWITFIREWEQES